jgi:hypothetical protein
MTDDYKQGIRPDQEDKQISVDDMGIPILKDVIASKIDEKPATNTPRPHGLNFSLPNNEILVTALRNQLRSQINNDIDDIAEEVSGKIISSLTQELEHNIKAELVEILQRNLDEMINHAISEDPKRGS